MYPTISVAFLILTHFFNLLLAADKKDKDIIKKIKEKIKHHLITRYQDNNIKNVLYISLYLNHRLKQLPMLTEIKKKEAIKIKILTKMLQESEQNSHMEDQEKEISESNASSSNQPVESNSKQSKLEKYFSKT